MAKYLSKKKKKKEFSAFNELVVNKGTRQTGVHSWQHIFIQKSVKQLYKATGFPLKMNCHVN